jgi:hypothetical protein
VCSLDESGTPELSEIDMGFLFFQQKIRDISAVRVAVVTEDGLPAFVEQCKSVVSDLRTILDPLVAKTWKDIQSRLGDNGTE